MYNEQADFIHHKAEMDTFLLALEHVGYISTPAHVVLDLGGGQGMHTGFLSQRFREVWCVDVINYSTLYGGEFLKLLVEKYKRHNVAIAADRITFLRGDAMNLLFRDGFFDVCLCINVFEHVSSPQLALAEIIRTLRPGGIAYISFDPVWTCDTGSHFFHRVSEPWAHLAYSDEKFVDKMLANGATADDVAEFGVAMNRWRLSQFESLFNTSHRRGELEILLSRRWSGVEAPEHERHPNLNILMDRGFEQRELMLRGLLYVIKKPGPDNTGS